MRNQQKRQERGSNISMPSLLATTAPHCHPANQLCGLSKPPQAQPLIQTSFPTSPPHDKQIE